MIKLIKLNSIYKIFYPISLSTILVLVFPILIFGHQFFFPPLLPRTAPLCPDPLRSQLSADRQRTTASQPFHQRISRSATGLLRLHAKDLAKLGHHNSRVRHEEEGGGGFFVSSRRKNDFLPGNTLGLDGR
jgi:hypothetical protein